MPTWKEAADFVAASVYESYDYNDPDREAAYNCAREDCIDTLRSKAAFEERATQLCEADETLFKIELRIDRWPGHEGEVVLVQYIRNDTVQLAYLLDCITEKRDNLMDFVKQQSEWERKAQNLPDWEHYKAVHGAVSTAEAGATPVEVLAID